MGCSACCTTTGGTRTWFAMISEAMWSSIWPTPQDDCKVFLHSGICSQPVYPAKAGIHSFNLGVLLSRGGRRESNNFAIVLRPSTFPLSLPLPGRPNRSSNR